MSVLTDDFRKIVSGLRQDPDLALIDILERLENWNGGPFSSTDSDTRDQVCVFIKHFAAKNKVQGDDLDPEADFSEVLNFLRRHSYLVKNALVEIEIQELIGSISDSRNSDSFGFAFLNPSEKARIHNNIDVIRGILNAADLADRKKNALLDKLNKLSLEVDLVGTATDRFFAFLGDAAFVLGDMATQAKPFTDEIKDMIKTIGRARSRAEGVALPPGEEVLTLPSPDEGDA